RVESPKPWAAFVRAIRSPVDPLPYTWAKYRSGRFRAQLLRTLRESRHDLIHCDHVQVAHVLHGVETPPRVVNAHNIEHLLVRRAADLARPTWRQAAIKWQASKTRAA